MKGHSTWMARWSVIMLMFGTQKIPTRPSTTGRIHQDFLWGWMFFTILRENIYGLPSLRKSLYVLSQQTVWCTSFRKAAKASFFSRIGHLITNTEMCVPFRMTCEFLEELIKMTHICCGSPYISWPDTLWLFPVGVHLKQCLCTPIFTGFEHSEASNHRCPCICHFTYAIYKLGGILLSHWHVSCYQLGSLWVPVRYVWGFLYKITHTSSR